jgi:hypothetical protein
MTVVQTPSPIKQTLSVVFLGSFNPRIFHPAWFEREGLALPEEAAASLSETQQNGLIITPDLSRCDIGPDISVECITGRLTINAATTLGEVRLRTLACALMTKLPHSPITAVGINHRQIFNTRDEDEWHRIGDLLVPKDDIWSQVMEGRPGMSSLRVEETRIGPPKVRVWATVEPVRGTHPSYCISIDTNWHTDITQNTPNQSEQASDFVESQWDIALDFGRKLARQIFVKIRT